jgi:hypothetical protein
MSSQDRPSLVCFYPPCYGFGLLPQFDQGKFRLAVFLDPRNPHFVVPVPSPEGTIAYRLDGPTRGGELEQVTVTCENTAWHEDDDFVRREEVFRCTCSPHSSCDHIRALRSLCLFTYYSAPYDLP